MYRNADRKTVMVVMGTRPEAVKLAPVVEALTASDWARPFVVTTGQHGDVVDEVLRLFDLKADVACAGARRGTSLTSLLTGLLDDIDGVLERNPADLIVVQGDTTSTLAGAMAGFLRRIPVVHVEAGLRTYDLGRPFPEEGNRRVAAQVTALHLAPTATAAGNLLREGVPGERVLVTGNTVVDALRTAVARRVPFGDSDLERVVGSGRRLVLVTAHRRESWGEPMRRIGRAVARIARDHADHDVVVAAHMNRAVREVLEAEVGGLHNVVLPGPIAYGAFARLLAAAHLVVTDSGGIQEEAPAFGTPALVLREVTERSESVQSGVARLVGTDEERIVSAASELLDDAQAYARMDRAVNPYGDGKAAARTAAACKWLLGLGPRPEAFAADPTG